MKVYTEEQVKEAIKLARVQKSKDFKTWFVNEEDVIMSGLTPIELPSDEEIEKESSDDRFSSAPFRWGAEWVIEQIKQQDK